MWEKLKKILRPLGLYPIAVRNTVPDYNSSDYLQVNDDKTGEAHVTYLNRLNEDENGRLTLIEAKTSQLISQTGIIFSLLSLFVPLLIDKVSGVTIWVKILLLILLLLAFLCYMLTINNALKNFKITDFPYSTPSAKNVLNLQTNSVSEFNSEVIRDLLHGLQVNKKLNNIKGTNLLHSYNAFKTANALTASLVSCFCISLLFLKQPDPTIKIANPIKIEHLDSNLNRLIDTVSKYKRVVPYKTVILKSDAVDKKNK
ncbi:hypothetical protein HDF24_06790 [Mucilaginibacter sp. X4EP1]|uniref:hypothetical protein n=1 Tax=Mucilaginibacter sp. X4EP1 TaxID=2723092 RepID=UPI002168C39B|nr:hypothetical protein [Mucilaginibacter sp. X4EP1]MCS3814013.1 hypothetical protein [Mucilaginibacter sp. X4EP1]